MLIYVIIFSLTFILILDDIPKIIDDICTFFDLKYLLTFFMFLCKRIFITFSF